MLQLECHDDFLKDEAAPSAKGGGDVGHACGQNPNLGLGAKDLAGNDRPNCRMDFQVRPRWTDLEVHPTKLFRTKSQVRSAGEAARRPPSLRVGLAGNGPATARSVTPMAPTDRKWPEPRSASVPLPTCGCVPPEKADDPVFPAFFPCPSRAIPVYRRNVTRHSEWKLTENAKKIEFGSVRAKSPGLRGGGRRHSARRSAKPRYRDKTSHRPRPRSIRIRPK